MKQTWPIVLAVGAGAAYLFKDQIAKLFAPEAATPAAPPEPTMPPAAPSGSTGSAGAPSDNSVQALAALSSPSIAEPTPNPDAGDPTAAEKRAANKAAAEAKKEERQAESAKKKEERQAEAEGQKHQRALNRDAEFARQHPNSFRGILFNQYQDKLIADRHAAIVAARQNRTGDHSPPVAVWISHDPGAGDNGPVRTVAKKPKSPYQPKPLRR